MDDFDWDFSDDDPYVNRRANAGCFLLVVGAVILVDMFVWIVHHHRQVELALFFAFLAGGAYFGRGYITPLLRRRARKDSSAIPTPLASVKPGSVHTTGLVGVSTPPLHAPLGAPPCAFFRVVIEPVHQQGATLFEARSADEIVLDDGAGTKLVVRLDGAKWLVRRQREMISSQETPDAEVLAYLAERGLGFDQPVRVRVAWIAQHELVFVRGVARPTAAPAIEAGYRTSEASSPLEIASTPERPVLIALEPIPQKRQRRPDGAQY